MRKFRTDTSWFKVLVELVAGALLSILLYYLVIFWLINNHPPYSEDMRRVMEVEKFCSAIPPRKSNRTFVLGSSVAVEGVDSHVIENHWKTQTDVFNLSMAGLSPREMILLLPSFKKAKPDVVMLGIDASGFDDNEIKFEKLQAYRSAEFASKIPAEERSQVLGRFFFPSEIEFLTAPEWKAWLNNRALPLFYMESLMRQRTRAELRMEGYATNFKAPWIRRTSLDAAKKEREIMAAVEKVKKLQLRPDNKQLGSIRFILTGFTQEKTRVIGVLWPNHPHLLSAFPPGYLQNLKDVLRSDFEDKGLPFYDLSDFLKKEEFADSVHPNALGRKKLSVKLAALLMNRSSK